MSDLEGPEYVPSFGLLKIIAMGGMRDYENKETQKSN